MEHKEKKEVVEKVGKKPSVEIQTALMIIVIAILALVVGFLAYSFPKIISISKLDVDALNKVAKIVMQNKNQIEFNKLANHTLALIEQFYYPNLQTDQRYVPKTIKSAINRNRMELQKLISQEETGAAETPEFYLLEGLFYCGDIATNIDYVDEAIESFEKYLDSRRYDAKVLTNLALCYVYGYQDDTDALEWYNKALKLYDEALDCEPSYCRAHYNKALALWKLGRQKDAIAEITNLVRNAPDCAEAFFVMSLIKCQMHEIDEAFSYLETAIQKGFNDISWISTTRFYDEAFKRSEAYKRAIASIKARRFILN